MTHAQNFPAIAESIHKQLTNKTNSDVSIDQIQKAVKKSFDGTSDDYESIKKANGVFHKEIKELGVTIGRTVLLNMVSKALGHGNHHSLKGCSAKAVDTSHQEQWYDFKEGRVTVIIGTSGSGKSVLLTANAQHLDSPHTLLVDYGGSYTQKNIKAFNERYGTTYEGFKQSKYIDVERGMSIPSVSPYQRVIIDEGLTISRVQKEALRRAINESKKAHLVLLLQTESDMFEFGLNPVQAERFYENVGPRTDIQNGESRVKIFQFSRDQIIKKKTPIEIIKGAVPKDYYDDAVSVFHESGSLEFTLKVAELAVHLKREPSIISRSKNLDEVYRFFQSTHNAKSEEAKSQMIRDLNTGLNKQ